jgi:lysophospholipase L1-like esterase
VIRHAGAALAVVVALAGVTAPTALKGQTRARSGQWITAWTSSHHTLGAKPLTNATVRMIARLTVPGDSVRIRLDNTFGTAPLVIGSAYVAPRTSGAALVARANKRVSFNNANSVTIPPGGTVLSDPVALKVAAWQDLAVSLYVPGEDTKPTQHTLAFVTSYVSANGSGDLSADESSMPFSTTTTSMFWLKAIEVQSSAYTGAIVAFGDSITDGNCSTVDGHDRWEDWLDVRMNLASDRGAIRKAVLNEGISGNTLGREGLKPAPDSPPALERLERDVLSHHGVTDVILFIATNDIRRESPASQVIANTQEIVRRVKAKGIRIVGATVIPRHNNTTNSPWDAAKTATRNEVNQWIRTKAPFDGFIEFDKSVRDSSNPDLLNPAYNCDNIHPTPFGYYQMGQAVPLEFFRH